MTRKIELAIRNFSRKLIDHPNLLTDPLQTILQLREDEISNLEKEKSNDAHR